MVHITWLGHSFFELRLDSGEVFLLDPGHDALGSRRAFWSSFASPSNDVRARLTSSSASGTARPALALLRR
jgi:hypothetical protein